MSARASGISGDEFVITPNDIADPVSDDQVVQHRMMRYFQLIENGTTGAAGKVTDLLSAEIVMPLVTHGHCSAHPEAPGVLRRRLAATIVQPVGAV